MGLLDFLSSDKKKSSHGNKQLLADLIEGLSKLPYNNLSLQLFTTLNAYPRYDQKSEPEKKEFLFFLLHELYQSLEEQSKSDVYKFNKTWTYGSRFLQFIITNLDFTNAEIEKISRVVNSFYKYCFDISQLPSKVLVERIEKQVIDHGNDPVLSSALKNLLMNETYSEGKKFNSYVYFLLQGDPSIQISRFDPFGTDVYEFLQSITEENKIKWIDLFKLCKQASGKSEPTKKWLKEAAVLIPGIGNEIFVTKLSAWLQLLIPVLQNIHKEKGPGYNFLREENHDILKGLIWCAGLVNDPGLNSVLDEYAVWAYKKKPSIGSISVKTGSACMCAFSMLPSKDGVPRLSKFQSKIRNNSILKAINKFIRTVSEREGVSIDEIEELSVPDYGLIDGKMSVAFGDINAIYSLEDGLLSWERHGKIQKSVPAEVKEKYSSGLKALKNTIKEIQALAPVLKDRLEGSYLKERSWNFTDWSKYYHNHPLVSFTARKLIWHFVKGNEKTQGIYHEGKFTDVNGKEINWLGEAVQVSLWHPIGFSSGEILQWREFLSNKKIVQPFKQAYREVYIITDAELRTESYSNRFAAHILRQHQFAALCRQRHWHYTLMGQWDSHNTPYVDLPHWRLQAMFFVDSNWNDTASANEMGIFNYITTDQVRFMRGREVVPMYDVPAIVFTEVMRDVDLFVGVTSIGNDPYWQDNGNSDAFMNDYWHAYSFSELSESANIRSEVLQSLIPRLKIASQCAFDKKFLIVKGKVRTYKIHMGSGNILMEPDDRYLCIVPDGSVKAKDKVFLPFEGDSLLSIIISKALLLAEDDKITDKTILSQIKVK